MEENLKAVMIEASEIINQNKWKLKQMETQKKNVNGHSKA